MCEGDYKGAVAALRKCLKADPTFYRAHYSLGLWLHDKDPEVAKAYFHHCVETDSKRTVYFVEALYRIGDLLRKKGDLVDAEATYLKVLSVDPEYFWAHYKLAKLQIIKGDLVRALVWFGECLTLNPKFVPALNSRGYMLHKQGDKKGAEADYRASLLAPSNNSG